MILGFTLQDEARATAHSSSWVGGSSRLRFATIKFISAGHLNKTDPVEQINSDADQGHLCPYKCAHTTVAAGLPTGSQPADIDTIVSSEATNQIVESVLFHDTLDESFREAADDVMTKSMEKSPLLPEQEIDQHDIGPTNTGPAHAANTVRAHSPTLSDSSEEVIVFRGRDVREREEAVSILSPSPQLVEEALPVDARLAIVEKLLHKEHDKLDEIVERHDQSTHQQALYRKQPQRSKFHSRSSTKCGRGDSEDDLPDNTKPSSVVHEATAILSSKPCRSERPVQSPEFRDEDFIGFISSAKKGKKFRDRDQKKRKQAEEELIHLDYLSNARQYNEIQDDSDEVRAIEDFARRCLADQSLAYSDQAESEASEDVADIFMGYDKQGDHYWDASDLHEFDNISTSDGVMGNLEVILARRERRGGLQYLVVWEDQPQDEARWVPLKTLVESGSQPHVDAFELGDIFQTSHQVERAASTSEDGSTTNVCRPSRNSAKKLPRDMCRTRSPDNGSDVDICALRINEMDSDFDIYEGGGLRCTSSYLATRGAKKCSRGIYPKATALADAFDHGYVEVPTRLNRKGRGKLPSFDISDSELEVSMRATWENDRRKKTEKKKAREQLRAQGLLQSKSGAPDLKQVYQNGISIQDVKKEIRIFLQTRNSTYVTRSHAVRLY